MSVRRSERLRPPDSRDKVSLIIDYIAPFVLPIISLCVALVAVILRRVYGLMYWMVPLCVTALSITAMLWMPKGDNKPVWILALALPTSLAFKIADTNALRAH